MPPDKPKRRKNNKNKRKNKNNRGDVSKNENNVKECNIQQIPALENEDSNEKFHEEEEETSHASSKFDMQKQPDVTQINPDTLSESNQVPENRSPLLINNDSSVSLNIGKTECPVPDIQSISTYIVEDPDQSKNPKQKISSAVKSKSLDNDDAPKIVEISDEGSNPLDDDCNLVVIESSNVIVSDVESDVEWEKTDVIIESENSSSKELATGTLSIATIPLDVANCDQTKFLTFEQETSLKKYLNTLNLSTQPENINSVEVKAEIEQILNREIKHRLRKKASADDFFAQRLGPPRLLDVIDEEGSGESSTASRRQSYLSDKNNDNDDLVDDVFEDKNKLNEKFNTKMVSANRNRSFGRLVPQECVLVGAKLKEPEITEARGDWSVKTVEQMTGAEIVYLTDSSSSTSSIHEIGDETDDGIETDVSVRIITPTIEVTDTENFLKKTFIPSSSGSESLNKKNQNIESVEPKEHVEHTIKIDVESDESNKNSFIPVSSNEIVVLSTDDIKTDLYVKDIIENDKNKITVDSTTPYPENTKEISQKQNNEYDLELKVIKCELNDAINNLLKEVSSDSELKNNTFTRQDSSSSVDSSQCTAKYNPDYSSLNDISNITHEETSENDNIKLPCATSHVKDVFECVSGDSTQSDSKIDGNTQQPTTLKNCCVKKITSLPYGDKILEELASVSERLQNINNYGSVLKGENKNQQENKMPYYPLPDLSTIEKVILKKHKKSVPPPIKPRRSSLVKKKLDEEHWTAVPSKTEPLYVCLSPSQKMLMEKTNTTLSQEDSSELIETHKKYVERRGYDEHDEPEKGSDIPPIIPFKSQTGSRLLALIRDPKITSNVNCTKKHYSSSVDQLEKKHSTIESNSYSGRQKYSTFQDFSNYFKPIPPPRPKKISSSFYESDECSDFTDNSLPSVKSEKKLFHYSTGNLNKEIENDISSIQNMHRFYTNVREKLSGATHPRRPSLPKDLCDQQMEYIRQKERELDAEIQRLEGKSRDEPSKPQRKGPRAPLISEKVVVDEKITDANNYSISRKKDVVISSPCVEARQEKSKMSSLFSSSQEEIQREKMYSEYVSKMAERQERKEHKIIKITNTPTKVQTISKSMSDLEYLASKINNPIEKEFISKARERWDKLGIKDPETEDEREVDKNIYKEPKVIKHKIQVITGGEEKEVHNLPSHIQEFVRFTTKEKNQGSQSPGESEAGPASPHVVIWCAVIVIILSVVKYFLRMLRYK